MRFKRPYLTAQAARKLGVHKYTLWRWGDQGRVRMHREGPQKVRVFDADEIDALAPRLKHDAGRGLTVFPSGNSPRKTKPKKAR